MASPEHKNAGMTTKPSVSITYCQVCGFRSRAAWLAQELLASNEQDVSGATLVPGRGGIFEVRIDVALVLPHEQAGRCAEARGWQDAGRPATGAEPAT